jgi:hypothetical protein
MLVTSDVSSKPVLRRLILSPSFGLSCESTQKIFYTCTIPILTFKRPLEQLVFEILWHFLFLVSQACNPKIQVSPSN